MFNYDIIPYCCPSIEIHRETTKLKTKVSYFFLIIFHIKETFGIGHKAAFLLEKLKLELSDFKKWKIYPDNPKNPDKVKSAVNGKKYLNIGFLMW